jgi:hypothetical protein
MRCVKTHRTQHPRAGCKDVHSGKRQPCGTTQWALNVMLFGSSCLMPAALCAICATGMPGWLQLRGCCVSDYYYHDRGTCHLVTSKQPTNLQLNSFPFGTTLPTKSSCTFRPLQTTSTQQHQLHTCVKHCCAHRLAAATARTPAIQLLTSC